MTADKAGKLYWDQVWENQDIPRMVDAHKAGSANHTIREFHRYFTQALAPMETRGKRFIEIGCARSTWLPYFAHEFGFDIWGLDYSEIGCAQSEQILKNEGIPGTIVHADVFDPPKEMLSSFDALMSFGVVEHFEDTAKIISAFGQLMKPGGRVLTVIPNVTGAVGKLQKIVDRAVYDIHVPLSREKLAQAHHSAGLEVLECRYFMSTSFYVNNLNSLDPSKLSTKAKSLFLRGMGMGSRGVWAIEERLRHLPISQFFSPYVVCTAKRPE